jgi:hypothetical protein
MTAPTTTATVPAVTACRDSHAAAAAPRLHDLDQRKEIQWLSSQR